MEISSPLTPSKSATKVRFGQKSQNLVLTSLISNKFDGGGGGTQNVANIKSGLKVKAGFSSPTLKSNSLLWNNDRNSMGNCTGSNSPCHNKSKKNVYLSSNDLNITDYSNNFSPKKSSNRFSLDSDSHGIDLSISSPKSIDRFIPNRAGESIYIPLP